MPALGYALCAHHFERSNPPLAHALQLSATLAVASGAVVIVAVKYAIGRAREHDHRASTCATNRPRPIRVSRCDLKVICPHSPSSTGSRNLNVRRSGAGATPVRWRWPGS